MNNDQAITSLAVQTACKLLQESISNGRLKLLLYIESTGATEWFLDNLSKRFKPNYFVEIGKVGLEIKRELWLRMETLLDHIHIQAVGYHAKALRLSEECRLDVVMLRHLNVLLGECEDEQSYQKSI